MDSVEIEEALVSKMANTSGSIAPVFEFSGTIAIKRPSSGASSNMIETQVSTDSVGNVLLLNRMNVNAPMTNAFGTRIILQASGSNMASITAQRSNSDSSGLMKLSTVNSGSQLAAITIDENQNVGIGTTTPGISCILNVSGNLGAVVLPRLTTAERDALTAIPGMIVYNTTTGTFQGFSASWGNLKGSA